MDGVPPRETAASPDGREAAHRGDPTDARQPPAEAAHEADPLDALEGECELVSQVALALEEEDFSRPTRCPAWNVKQLLGHMYRDMLRVLTGLAEPAPDAADADSVSYWRIHDPSVDDAAIAERAIEVAARQPTGRTMARAWDEMWKRAVSVAAGADRSRVVRTWGPALPLGEFLKTRVLEITVHGTDLARALGREPWATRAGLEITGGILLALLGADLPEGLVWDRLTLAEKGTGRVALSPEDASLLGDSAGAFPLLA